MWRNMPEHISLARTPFSQRSVSLQCEAYFPFHYDRYPSYIWSEFNTITITNTIHWLFLQVTLIICVKLCMCKAYMLWVHYYYNVTQRRWHHWPPGQSLYWCFSQWRSVWPNWVPNMAAYQIKLLNDTLTLFSLLVALEPLPVHSYVKATTNYLAAYKEQWRMRSLTRQQ